MGIKHYLALQGCVFEKKINREGVDKAQHLHFGCWKNRNDQGRIIFLIPRTQVSL